MIDSKTMDALLSGQIYVLLFLIFFSVCCSSSSYFPVAPNEKKARKWATIIYDFNGARNIKLERLKRKRVRVSVSISFEYPRKWTNNANWVLALITFT